MALKPGDLLVLEDPEVEGGVTQHAVLDVMDDLFLLGDDPTYGEIDFAPYPVIFSIKDGILLGFEEGVSVREIIDGGATAETLVKYQQLSEDVERADAHNPSDEEYDAVADHNEETIDQIAALTIYSDDVLLSDGTVRAAALLTAIGIPLPNREKLILLGMAFDNLSLAAMDATDPEDEDETDDDQVSIAGLDDDGRPGGDC